MDRNNMGALLVNVRYANGAAPVSGGRVVLQKDGERIGEYRTDEGGKTDTISLSVGDTYSIKVFADGFIAGERDEIPIVGGMTTLQNICLFPSFGENGEGII